jgi:hypothetical protein
MRLGLALLAAGLATRVLAAVVSLTPITLAAWEKTLGVAAMHDAELAAWVLLASGLASASLGVQAPTWRVGAAMSGR